MTKIELTLGSVFRELEGSCTVDPYDFHTYRDIVERDFVLIPPRGFVLGRAPETVCVPRGHVGLVFARSSLLRCGLSFGCGVLWPGWAGEVVLELGNLNSHRSLKLYVGEPVAHVLLMPAGDLEQYSGRYASSNPMGPV